MAQAQELITRLEKLRNQRRSPVKEGLVQAVMVQSASFEEKIRRIEMIDLLPEDPPTTVREVAPKPTAPRPVPRRRSVAPPVRVSSATPVPRPDSPLPLVDPSLPELVRVEHYRRRLNRPPLIGGWWRYWLSEYSAIARFGDRTGTLMRGPFPFTWRISEASLVYFKKTLGTTVLPILEHSLPMILKKSWMHLTKRQYNLLAALRVLCVKAGAISVSPGTRRPRVADWDPLLPCLRLFRTGSDVSGEVLDAWDQAARGLSLAENARLEGAESIASLVVSRQDAACLPDVLAALIMLRTHRAFRWDEESFPQGAEFFAKDTFDCPVEVQSEIDRATDQLSAQIDAMAKELIEVRRIRYFLPEGPVLEGFDRGLDRSDRGPWCVAFIDRLESALRPLLAGVVTLASGESTRLFQNPSLEASLDRLASLRGLMLDPAVASNPEPVAATARVVMNLGKTLVVLIRNRSRTADPLIRSPDPNSLTDPLPREAEVLDFPATWAGLTVVQALIQAARYCLLAGRFLGETSLDAGLEKEATLPPKIAELLVRFRRLAPEIVGEAKRAQLADLWVPPPVET